ncbi:MAG: hypothetical protein ACRES9_06540 [Gammaproteobacteria bacterium]
MFQRILGLIVSVVGVFIALVVGFWALLGLAFVAIGAAIVHAFRSRGWAQGRQRRRRDVIEGEFSVLEERKPGEGGQGDHGSSGPHSRS